jgi:RNA polymerase sigma factor (sigma-70 family)
MNSELLARLIQAEPEERPWLLMKAVLESLSEELQQAVWAVAVPHWFDVEIVAAVCPALAERAGVVYEALQELSFVEVFGDRGHNIHEATRRLLLDRLWHDRLEEFRAVSALAAAYFAEDRTNRAEWLYHKLVAVPEISGDDADFDRVMAAIDYGYQRSESEVVLQAVQEQISANRVGLSVMAQTAYWEGRVLKRSYENQEVLERYETAIDLYRQVGDRLRESNTLGAIGDEQQFLDQRERALENYTAASAFYQKVSDKNISEMLASLSTSIEVPHSPVFPKSSQSLSGSWSEVAAPRATFLASTLSNYDLILQCQVGLRPSKNVFAELIRRYHPHVEKVLSHLAPDWTDRADLAQEVWIRVYRNIGRLQEPEKFRGWLSRIASNLFYDELRKRKRVAPPLLLDSVTSMEDGEMDRDIASDEASLAEELATQEFHDQLRSAIADLPEAFRTTIVLREIEGLAYEEIAEITGVSLGTVKSRIARAKLRLTQQLQGYQEG